VDTSPGKGSTFKLSALENLRFEPRPIVDAALRGVRTPIVYDNATARSICWLHFLWDEQRVW
jgi:hypothetical protein